MTTAEQEGGNRIGEERSDASAPRGGARATLGLGAAPSLDEQIAQTMRASMEEKDPVKRSALNGQIRALYEQKYPETPQAAELTVTVPLTPEQEAIADNFAHDVTVLATETGADPGQQVGALFDFTVGRRSGTVRSTSAMRTPA